MKWLKRFWKREHPRVPIQPGSIIHLTNHGQVVATVMLSEVVTDMNDGTTAKFVSLNHFMKDRRVW